jgi:hypothetical protein
MTRRRVSILLVLMAVGAGLAVGFAHSARADEQAFLDAVAVLGYTDHADALSAGYAVCSLDRVVGSSLTERILRKIMGKVGDLRDAENVNPFADAAKENLC